MRPCFVLAPSRLSLGRNLRMGGAQTKQAMKASTVAESTRAVIRENNVMVFSKSWCPYCTSVKTLFKELGVEHGVWELDEKDNGDEIHDFLIDDTGLRTVPNVFIKGKHIGGWDGT